MTSQEEDTDEEYLDDPIKLIDFEQERVQTEALRKSEMQFRHEGYDPTDSDGDVLIENESPQSLGRFAVTLPATFFDYSRNVRLLNKCKPLLIKLVDFRKHQWYYKKQIQKLDTNIIVIDEEPNNNNTKVQRKESTVDVDIEKKTLKPKIRPVDITAYVNYNKLFKRNSPTKENKHVKEDGKKHCLPAPPGFKKIEFIDFKRNVGLVGLKISHGVDSNVSNSKIMNVKSELKNKEVQATVTKCVDSPKHLSISTSDKQKPHSKIENKSKQLNNLKPDQSIIKLSTLNKDLSGFNVNADQPLATFINNNEVIKQLTDKVNNDNDLVKEASYINEYAVSAGKQEKILTDIENRKPKELQSNYTGVEQQQQRNSIVGLQVKFHPATKIPLKGEIGEKEKLSSSSQAPLKTATESKVRKVCKKNVKNVNPRVEGKIKVPNKCKKDKKKAKNEKKDKILDSSKDCSEMNVCLNKDNVLKMLITIKPKIASNANQKLDPVQSGKQLNTENQTTKTLEITQNVTFNENKLDCFTKAPKEKAVPGNGIPINNVMNYYQITSKSNPNPAILAECSQQNVRKPTVGNKQLGSFNVDTLGPPKSTNAQVIKTNKSEYYVGSGTSSQISLHINSNKNLKESSVIETTLLPQVSARHSNLPEIIQKKPVCIVNNTTAGKPIETNVSGNSLALKKSTTNKQLDSKQTALRIYGMFDAKGNSITQMSNRAIYTVPKSKISHKKRSKMPVDQVPSTQFVQERCNTSDGVVIDHQSNSNLNNHSERQRIYVRRVVTKSNSNPEERSQIIANRFLKRSNMSDDVVINHRSNFGLTNHGETQEIVARRKSDNTPCINIGNNSATLNKIKDKGHYGVPNTFAVTAAAATPQESHSEFKANGNYMNVLSYVQEKNNVQHKYPTTDPNISMGKNMIINHGSIGNVGLHVNVPNNNIAVSVYQPMPQQHAGYQYQGQPIQTFVGNRPTQNSTQMQRSLMNVVAEVEPYHRMMQNEVCMNYSHCTHNPNMTQNMNLPVEGSFYNTNYDINQLYEFWPCLYPPPPPPPPPVEPVDQALIPAVSLNTALQLRSTCAPSPVINNSSIIGRNNSGVIRKINIVAVPPIEKEKSPKLSSVSSNPLDNSDDKPVNSKLEMLEELTKVTMDIPPDSPVQEKIAAFPTTKSNNPEIDFSNTSSVNINNQSRSIPTKDELKEEVISPKFFENSAFAQNVPTLTTSKHNVSSCKPNRPTSFQKPFSPNRDPRGKFVLPVANKGYSPPILPILTYEKTLEYIAQAHPETRHIAERDDFRLNGDKLSTSIVHNSHFDKCKKRKLIHEEEKEVTQDKSVKKISLDEYKKRAGKSDDKSFESDYSLTIKLECKTEKLDDMKKGSDLVLGYESDSTMIL